MRNLKLQSQLRFLGVLIFILRSATLVSANGKSNFSVYYYEENPFNFFMAENMTFDSKAASSVIKGHNFCKCQAACTEAGQSCQAWSVVTLDDENTVECRLTEFGPTATVPFTKEGATYFFKETSIPGTYSWQRDHLLYVHLDKHYRYEMAVKECGRIPGHRLIIIKNEATFDYFGSLSLGSKTEQRNSKPSWLADLIKINNSYFVWGDGTSFADTDLPSGSLHVKLPAMYENFISYSGRLYDAKSSYAGPFRITCQANPIGMNW